MDNIDTQAPTENEATNKTGAPLSGEGVSVKDAQGGLGASDWREDLLAVLAASPVLKNVETVEDLVKQLMDAQKGIGNLAENGNNTWLDSADYQLIPVTKWNNFFHWPPPGGMRHIIFHAKTNGFADAIHRVGKTVLIEPNKFWEIAKNQGRDKS